MRWYNINRSQTEKLSDIFADVGLVSFASVMIPGVIGTFNLGLVIPGLTLALGFWAMSLRLRK